MERIILPDSTILVDYMLSKTHWLISGLRVNAERMKKNLDLTRGLVFSGQLLLDLTAAGVLREEAYRIVQAHAMQAWETDGDFRAAVSADPRIQGYLPPDRLARIFSISNQLDNVDLIFRRVFEEP